MHGKLMLALTCLSIGCAAGALSQSRAAAQIVYQPNPAAPKWEQFCHHLEPEDIDPTVRKYGADGWELAGLSFRGAQSWVCFRRPGAHAQ